MNRKAPFIGGVLFVIVFTGCGDDDSNSEDSTPSTAAALAAIEEYVASEGEIFDGECPQSGGVQPHQCAIPLGSSGDQLGYAVGGSKDDIYGVYFVTAEDDEYVIDHIEGPPCLNATPCPPSPGEEVIIFAPECANVREEPGIESDLVECVPVGTRGIVAGAGVEEDARTWVELEGMGWVATTFIACGGECR